MLDDVVEGILEFIFYLFIEIICFYTGEIILFIITIGRRKPRWGYHRDDSLSKRVILSEISFWLGAVFWIMLVICLAYIFI